MLFDIGFAGPIAGFLVAVPALILGIAMSHVVPLPANTGGMLELGEPLLFKLTSSFCGARHRRAIRSTSIRLPLRRGSGCSPRR